MAVRLRPRNAWEALDLGAELTRANARALYATFIAAYVPVALVVHGFMWEEPFWAWLVLWWLKPLFDRLALDVIARRLFGDATSIRAALKAWPGIAWRSGIIGALTWRRLDMARSLHLPVYQLERLSGKAARARAQVLDREARSAGVWLTFVLANMEMLFALAVSLAVAFLLPVQAPVETLLQGWWRGQFESENHAGVLLGALAVCAIEPLYVACGFTLYLQRRTMLEGWDIELRFRQLAERIEKLKQAAVATAATLLAAFALALCMPATQAFAQEGAKDASKEIRAVLADKEFGHQDTVKRLKYIGPKWKGSSGSSQPMDWSWLKTLSQFLGQAARAAAWIAGAAVILFALYHVARYVRLHGHGRGRHERPDFLFGLDVRAGSLPADVAGAAEKLARDGHIREALSLLYRASLVRFMDEGIEFMHGDTEGDCMRRVERAADAARKAYFRRLVADWQSLAYGHQPLPRAAAISQALGWRDLFDAPRGMGVAPQAQPA